LLDVITHLFGITANPVDPGATALLLTGATVIYPANFPLSTSGASD
jgi:hypothetical protein